MNQGDDSGLATWEGITKKISRVPGKNQTQDQIPVGCSNHKGTYYI